MSGDDGRRAGMANLPAQFCVARVADLNVRFSCRRTDDTLGVDVARCLRARSVLVSPGSLGGCGTRRGAILRPPTSAARRGRCRARRRPRRAGLRCTGRRGRGRRPCRGWSAAPGRRPTGPRRAHRSDALPCMSNSPNPFGSHVPTGAGRRTPYTANRRSAFASSPWPQRPYRPPRHANSHSDSAGRRHVPPVSTPSHPQNAAASDHDVLTTGWSGAGVYEPTDFQLNPGPILHPSCLP